MKKINGFDILLAIGKEDADLPIGIITIITATQK